MENENVYFEALKGLTANFIGDSLFGGHGVGKENTWIALLCEKYGITYNNYGINGCTLSACEGGANPIIRRYSGMADNSPDFVVIEGGRNDFNKCAAIGTVDDGDETSYCGALALLVKGLREKYPTAKIIAVSFWKSLTVNKSGISSNEYVEAMIAACDAIGIPCIRAYDEDASGIRMTDRDFRAAYSWGPGDVCHLNHAGMKLAMPFFERELAKILAEK